MAEMEQLFNQAMQKVFENWTAVNLAVEQGWGGRDSRQKRQLLQEEVVERLTGGTRRKRPPCHTNVDDVQEFADYLYTRIDELFNCELDDSSEKEVASVTLHLFNTCRAGDASFAQQFIQSLPIAPVDLSRCEGQDTTEYATEEDMLLDGIAGMDIDDTIEEGDEDGSDDGDMNGDQVSSQTPAPMSTMAQPAFAEPVKQAPQRIEPEVDEDGFTSVAKGHRRPKGGYA